MNIEIISFSYLEVNATLEMLNDCHHQGDCINEVEHHLADFIELNMHLSPEDLKKELKEYGAWDAEQLADHTENMRRILWIAAGNYQEEKFQNEN